MTRVSCRQSEVFKTISSRDLKVGEWGVVVDSDHNLEGAVLVKCYKDTLVNILDPNKVWLHNPDFKVRKVNSAEIKVNF